MWDDHNARRIEARLEQDGSITLDLGPELLSALREISPSGELRLSREDAKKLCDQIAGFSALLYGVSDAINAGKAVPRTIGVAFPPAETEAA